MADSGEIREFIKMEGESSILKYKEFRGLQISYRIDDNMIHLTELARFLQSKYHVSFDLYKYLDSKEFNLLLMATDNSMRPKANVYLLDFGNKICKVGQSFDIRQRYDNKLLSDYLVSLYAVDNGAATEQEILTEMRKTYKEIEGRREYFKYKSIDPIIRLFNSIASKHKVQLQKYNSKLIDFSEIHSHYFNGIYSHPDIAKIIIRKFCSNLDDIRNWIKLLESHKYEIKGATLNIMRDETTHQDNIFWYYNGYVFIKNVETNYYNASRLVNSILRTDGNPNKRLNEFLKSNKRFQKAKEEFKSIFKKDGIIDNTTTTTSKLKGIYVHEYLIDSIIRWVSPKYELATNIFIREMPKIMSSDKSAEEKVQEMKDLMKMTILKISDRVPIQSKRSAFDVSMFMHGGSLPDNIMSKLEFEEE